MPGKAIQKLSRAKKVAIYIRVSTTYQIDRDSLPMQRKDLIAYAELVLGIEEYEIFEDAGYSGKNTDRPAFQEMMQRTRKGEFTHILVWKIDRISRNLLDFAEMYEELQELRVTFVSKNEQFDTSTAIGEAMLKIILVFAELERNMTSERVTAAMISRASNGQWNGGRVPYGYDYDPERKEFSIREDEERICQLLKKDYLESKSLTHTARFLNESGFKTRADAEWSPTAVWIIASSPFYAGIYRYNRYKGTERRVENPEEEWVLVPDHHPAIFTLEEHEAMLQLLKKNLRSFENPIGRPHSTDNIHLFSGIVYCGKCGSKMTSTPGRLHADGYRTSTYSCPKRRKTKDCDNPSVNDLIIGEFVINYILNMLNAKSGFSKIRNPEALEKKLLFGSTFAEVDHVEENGLNEFYNLLSRYGSDDSYTFAIRKPRKKRAAVDPEIEKLRREKEKHERALKRLQNLLYSDSPISEKEFIIKKSEISKNLEDVNSMLGMVSRGADSVLSDEEFVKQASHLLISKELSDRQYIYFKKLVQSVSPEILKTYMETILDSVMVIDGRISSIVFRNGLTHKFIYKA